jgi:hypothetical protein
VLVKVAVWKYPSGTQLYVSWTDTVEGVLVVGGLGLHVTVHVKLSFCKPTAKVSI